MRSAPHVWLRLPAIYALLVIQGVATVLALVFGYPANWAIDAAEWASDARANLREGTA